MPERPRRLELWQNGEHVGTWTVAAGVHTLAYSKDWLENPHCRPLSLSLPLQPPGHPLRGRAVRDWFANLLPDSAELRERIRKRHGAASTEPMDLLAEIGRDCVGALQLTRADAGPPSVEQIAGRPLTDGDVARILEELPQGGPFGEIDFRFSVAGAHEKWALLRHRGGWCEPLGSTPTTHLLKLPVGLLGNAVDLSESLENEWLCGRILRAWGTPVASSRIVRFGSTRALVVERFDRRLAADGRWIMRLPQEDLAQATGTPPDRKYESDGGPGIRSCLDILLGATDPLRDREDFFRTQLLFFLLGAIDGHAKNFSLLHEAGGGYRLAPRYDVLSAWPVVGAGRGRIPIQRLKLAMALWGKNRRYEWQRIHRRHVEVTARDCDLHLSGGELIDQVCGQLAGVIEQVEGELPRDFPEQLARSIFEGLQRGAEQLSAASRTRS